MLLLRMNLSQTVLVITLACICFANPTLGNRLELESAATAGQLPSGWAETSAPEASERMFLTLAIKQQNLAVLAGLLEQTASVDSPHYGQWSTYQEVSDLVKPSARCESAVFVEWLGAFAGVAVERRPSPDWAVISAPVSTVEALLHVKLSAFVHLSSSKTIIRSLAGYSVPAEVAECLDFVGGIIRFPRIPDRSSASAVASAASSEVATAFQTNPALIQSLYNVTVAPASPTNIQAVASFLQQYYSPADLAQFQSMFEQPNLPIANLLGPNNSSDTGTEATLDVQYINGVTDSSVTTWVYSTEGATPSGNEPFLDWLLFLQQQHDPNVYSISYQDYENTVSFSYASRVCTEFMKFSQAGKTFFTGSGDWGVGCKDLGNGASSFSCTLFNADFPSSCPYVVSLGSTTLVGRAETREGASFSSGGFSNYFPRPS